MLRQSHSVLIKKIKDVIRTINVIFLFINDFETWIKNNIFFYMTTVIRTRRPKTTLLQKTT